MDLIYELYSSLAQSPLLRLDFSGEYVYDYILTSALWQSGLVAERFRRKSATVHPRAAVVVDPRNTMEFSCEFNKTRCELER